MVSLSENLIKLGDKTFPITRYEVWFAGPRGLCLTIDEALTVCTNENLDPTYNIKGVPVAISGDPSIVDAYEVI
jgi:hypothetical protein